MPGRRDERFPTELRVQLEGGVGFARNVSASGVYFLTDVALTVGQSIQLTFEFTQFPGGPITANCNARVVRIEQHGAMCGVGAAVGSFEFRRATPAS